MASSVSALSLRKRKYSAIKAVNQENFKEKDATSEMLTLPQEYGILRGIFHYLSVSELANAGRVCRNWNEVANVEKYSRRGCPKWFTFHSLKDLAAWKLFANTLRCQPAICLTFSTMSFQLRQKVTHQIQKLTRKIKCPLVSVAASDIVQSTIYQDYILVENWFPVQYAFLLPAIPDVNIVTFRLNPYACRKLSEEGKGIPESLQDVGGPNMPLKCLLYFCTKSTLYASRLAVKLQSRQQEGIAIGGAIVPTVHVDEEDESTVGIAIYGENVAASSLVFHDSVRCEMEIDQEMRKFRDQVVDGRHNLAFLFSCESRCLKPKDVAGRYLEISKECSVEARAFRRHFSTKHFIGVMGAGELGCTCLPAETDVVEHVPFESDEVLRLTYSVVVVHIAFGVPVDLRRKQQIQPPLCHSMD